jgi:hypothetical protein
MKKIYEDHKEIASGKKVDDEGYMARSEIDTIEKAIQNLRKSIKSGKQQLPAWVQSKITKATDYIDTAAEYLQSDEGVNEDKVVKGILKPTDPKTVINKDDVAKQRRKNLVSKKLDVSDGEKYAAKNIAKKLGGTGAQLPKLNKEEISLVEKILGEEKCGKGMYWCNTDKVCKSLPEGMKVPGQKIKPTEVGIGKAVDGSCTHTKKGKSCPVHGMKECPMAEEKDPKGPTQSYKSPEELAKKHGVSLKNIQKQVQIGTKVEFEHTSDKNLARITALQHLDELPDYYAKLKKMETQKESSIIRDANGNYYAEFIDIIRSGSIEEENPCWKGYTQVGMKMKNGKEVPNCVPSKGVPKAKGYKKEKVDEATRIPTQTGNNVFVTLSWRGKYYNIQIFFPQAKVPSRLEVSDEIQKIYPGSRVVTYRVADFKQGEPLIYAYKGGNGGKLGPNKNYVKPMGEEVDLEEAGDWWHPDPEKDKLFPGRGPKLRARENNTPEPDYNNKLKPGETYMQFAKRKEKERKVKKEEVEITEVKK